MSRLDELIAQRDSLLSQYLQLSRGLTRVPPGSRLAQLSPRTLASGTAGVPAPSLGAVTITPGASTSKATVPGLGLAVEAALGPGKEALAPGVSTLLGSETLAGMLPGVANLGANLTTGGLPAALFGATHVAGQAVPPAAISQIFGVGPGIEPVTEAAGVLGTGGLDTAQAVAGWNPLIAAGLSFLPLLWGGAPLTPISLFSSPDKPSAQKRHDAALGSSQADFITALGQANTLPEIAGLLTRSTDLGAPYTAQSVTDPRTLTTLLSASLFGDAANRSQGNVAAQELLRALFRATPENHAALADLFSTVDAPAFREGYEPIIPEIGMTESQYADTYGGYFRSTPTTLYRPASLADITQRINSPLYVEGMHPETMLALARARGVPISGTGGTATPAGQWVDRQPVDISGQGL